MKKIIYTTIIFTLALVSCNDDLENVIPQEKNNITTVSHAIPVEDALDNLQNFLDNLEKNTVTRADFDTPKRRIGTVDVIRKRDAVTRGDVSEDLDADSLLYVVNFEDNQGYALLAADDRISSPLIFVGDSGNVNMGDLGITFPVAAETRRIYPEFPTTGSGTFYENNDSTGFLFMNPNTFDLYIPEMDDYLVGDFYYGGQEEYEQMILSFINNQAIEYVKQEIIQNSGNLDDVDKIIYDEDPLPNEGYYTTVTVERDTIETVYKLLDFAKSWSQSLYFNKYCPNVKDSKTGEIEKAAAGCVSLAIAKIMTHHQYPPYFSTYGHTINWNIIKNNPSSNNGLYAGILTRSIRDNCFTIYFNEGTFTLPSTTASYLRNRGYSNVKYRSFDTDIVKNMLDNDCPVMICSVPAGSISYQLGNSHAWNIDGYMNKTTIYIIETYQYDTLKGTTTITENNLMLHCDFGWQGVCNGYFTPGVFDLSDEDVIFDDERSIGLLDTYYKWYIKMIQYDKPN